MAKIFITEYNVYGDTAVGMVLEPSHNVQEVNIGEVSAMLGDNTRVVTLFSELPCYVQFYADGDKPDAANAWPMADETEVQRLIHMGTKMRVATFERD
jgi:hypothetical protein